MTKEKLKLLYDGSCLVCHKEISYYKKNDKFNQLELVDISQPSFNADKYKLTDYEVNKYFHAITEKDEVIKGVPAFIKIWEVLPGFEKWAKIAKIWPFTQLMKIGYLGFINIRPYLPKRKNCDI